MSTDYTDELDTVDRERLGAASRNLRQYGNVNPAVTRYAFYRRKGFNKHDSLAFAIMWARNSTEQAGRRLAHDTGCQSWAERSPGLDRVGGPR